MTKKGRKEDSFLLTKIKVRHYLWCKKNGRDTTWYTSARDVQNKQLSSNKKFIIVRTARSKG